MEGQDSTFKYISLCASLITVMLSLIKHNVLKLLHKIPVYIFCLPPVSEGESVRLRFKWVHSLRIGYFGANVAVILRLSVVCVFLSSPTTRNVRKGKMVVLCYSCFDCPKF